MFSMGNPDMSPSANSKTGRTLALAAAVALALGLSACDQSKTASTPGEKLDSAIATTEQKANEAKADAAAAGAEAKANVQAAGAEAKADLKEAGADAKAAVGNAGTAVVNAVDDVSITAAVSTGLAKDPDLSAIRIDVDTKGGAVTLSGPAPSATAKARAEEIAKGVSGVTSVVNNLEIKS